ncbi:MAG: hypothetical protein QOF48_119 [Verrucomicrobiota bacterium]|jgi:hypothetical protein
MGVVGVIVLAIYGALSSGISTIRMARENLRATQILLEKMEGVRLYTWEQLNTPGFVPTNFIVAYDALTTNTNATGVRYYGEITIANSTNTTTYADSMRLVTVSLRWTTGTVPRSRSVQTYVSEAGIQNYIY